MLSESKVIWIGNKKARKQFVVTFDLLENKVYVEGNNVTYEKGNTLRFGGELYTYHEIDIIDYYNSKLPFKKFYEKWLEANEQKNICSG